MIRPELVRAEARKRAHECVKALSFVDRIRLWMALHPTANHPPRALRVGPMLEEDLVQCAVGDE